MADATPPMVNLRLFRYKGVVYMLSMDKKVYCYNPEEPIQVGVWDKEAHMVRFIDGALDALACDTLDAIRDIHKKSPTYE